jgi:hypothetical protein
MNDELMASFERKMIGYIQARAKIAHACECCGQWLEPHDTGVDPVNGKRIWITDCCGIKHSFEEKVAGFEAILND